jgi:hypothetical protein
VRTSCLHFSKLVVLVTFARKMAGIVEDQDKTEVFVPPAVLHEALNALNKVVPAKSKHSYEKEYAIF